MYEPINCWKFQASTENEPEQNPQGNVILSVDGEVIFYPDFFSPDESDRLFSTLYAGTRWQQETIQMFGKQMPLPRLTAWHGDAGKIYTYSGIKQYPEPWTPSLLLIKARIEQVADITFNSVLLNLYRSGNDHVSWHRDAEPELGQNPIIGSVSFGATRRVLFKHESNHQHIKVRKVEIDLPHGSFLLMRGETQHHWQHQVTKTTKVVTPRINLTFRNCL